MITTILAIEAVIILFLGLVIYIQRKNIKSLEIIIFKFQDDLVNVFRKAEEQNKDYEDLIDDKKE